MLRRAVGFQTSTSSDEDVEDATDGKSTDNDPEDDEDPVPNSTYPSLPSELDNELLDGAKCRIYFRCLAKLLISCSNKQKSFLGAHPGNLREAIKQMTVDIDAASGESFTTKVSSSLTRFFIARSRFGEEGSAHSPRHKIGGVNIQQMAALKLFYP